MQLFAGELTNKNREYYKVNDNKNYWRVNRYFIVFCFILQLYEVMVCMGGYACMTAMFVPVYMIPHSRDEMRGWIISMY